MEGAGVSGINIASHSSGKRLLKSGTDQSADITPVHNLIGQSQLDLFCD